VEGNGGSERSSRLGVHGGRGRPGSRVVFENAEQGPGYHSEENRNLRPVEEVMEWLDT